MKRRISLWAVAGLIVASGWALAALVTGPWSPSDPIWTIVDITCPAALLRTFPLKIYWFILLNVLTYGMFGAGTELLRRRPVARVSS
jgi:hypothetical protein